MLLVSSYRMFMAPAILGAPFGRPLHHEIDFFGCRTPTISSSIFLLGAIPFHMFKNLCASWTVPCMGKVNVFMHVCMCIYIYMITYVCEAVWTWTWLSKVILQLNTRSWALKFLAALQHVLVLLTKEGVVWAIWQGTRVVAFGNSFEGCSTPFHSPISEASRQNRQFCSHDPDPFPSLAHFTNSNRNHVLSGQVWSLLQCDPILLRAGYLSISCKGCRWQV